MKAELERCARLALAAVHRPYPYKLAHVLARDADALTPAQLHPVFFGCFDWHSAVHGHWTLVRAARLLPGTAVAESARAALAKSFVLEKLEGEREYLAKEAAFEMPYGMGWLLQLCAELREWDEARGWAAALAPLEALASERLVVWTERVAHPIRSGEHSQSAFAMGLALDWARAAGERELAGRLRARATTFHGGDRDWSFRFEPSGHDFLSPGLASADLMRRVLAPVEFADWLTAALPEVPRDGSASWLPVAMAADPADGKLVHMDGLSLSRAWMLEGIASGLLAKDPRRAALASAALAHRKAGLLAMTDAHYAGSHWLGSFGAYLVTGRGLAEGGTLS